MHHIDGLPASELIQFPNIYFAFNHEYELTAAFKVHEQIMVNNNGSPEESIFTIQKSPLALVSFLPVHIIVSYINETPEQFRLLPELKTIIKHKLNSSLKSIEGFNAPKMKTTNLDFMCWDYLEILPEPEGIVSGYWDDITALNLWNDERTLI